MSGRWESIPAWLRWVSGLGLGLIIMIVVVRVFFVSTYDFDIISGGVRVLLTGQDPWQGETAQPGFYNPPFSMFHLWIMMLTDSRGLIVIGGALILAWVFYHRAWVALAWFGTHAFWWVVSAGSISMYVMGCGLILLAWSDRVPKGVWQTAMRVVAYGFLLVKPQGGMFIVALYILMRRDWLGAAVSAVVYGLAFAPLYPGWVTVLFIDPPISQTLAPHSLGARFSLALTVPVAVLVVFSRRWTYWQLGAALAAILSPYGLPGVLTFLILSAVRRKAAIPGVLVFSGCLAVMTWVAPQSPWMGVYHLGMLGLVLILACLESDDDLAASDVIDLRAPVVNLYGRIKARLHS